MSGFQRAGSLLSWGVVPVIVLAQFFDLRRAPNGQPSQVSVYFIVFAAITVVTLPWVIRNLREVSRTGRTVGLAWFALMAVGLVSACTTALPYIRPEGVDPLAVPRSALIWPVVTSMLTATAAFGLVLAAPIDKRHHRAIVGALTLAVTTPIAGPRTMHATHTSRLATGLGGAATLHVALLCGLGVLVGGAIAARRAVSRWTCVAGSALCAVAILLTGSRAGWACLVLFVIVAGMLATKESRRWMAWVVGVLVLAGIITLLVLPEARRLLRVRDTARAVNLRGGMNALGEHWWHWIVGAGQGRVWPWYAFDAGLAERPASNLMVTSFGTVATNPHSLFFGVLVELGLVGLALLAVIVGMLIFRLVVTLWTGTPATLVPRVAVVCTLPAMLVDTYLVKNFGVSFVWWLAVASYFGVRARRTSDLSDAPADATWPETR